MNCVPGDKLRKRDKFRPSRIRRHTLPPCLPLAALVKFSEAPVVLRLEQATPSPGVCAKPHIAELVGL